ncbi:MAG: hypothetical protein LHV68_02260 [Elusimicrobia bacterium]|nr:hypothetical protein [Candidatus Liberimonas magnetica]
MEFIVNNGIYLLGYSFLLVFCRKNSFLLMLSLSFATGIAVIVYLLLFLSFLKLPINVPFMYFYILFSISIFFIISHVRFGVYNKKDVLNIILHLSVFSLLVCVCSFIVRYLPIFEYTHDSFICYDGPGKVFAASNSILLPNYFPYKLVPYKLLGGIHPPFTYLMYSLRYIFSLNYFEMFFIFFSLSLTIYIYQNLKTLVSNTLSFLIALLFITTPFVSALVNTALNNSIYTYYITVGAVMVITKLYRKDISLFLTGFYISTALLIRLEAIIYVFPLLVFVLYYCIEDYIENKEMLYFSISILIFFGIYFVLRHLLGVKSYPQLLYMLLFTTAVFLINKYKNKLKEGLFKTLLFLKNGRGIIEIILLILMLLFAWYSLNINTKGLLFITNTIANIYKSIISNIYYMKKPDLWGINWVLIFALILIKYVSNRDLFISKELLLYVIYVVCYFMVKVLIYSFPPLSDVLAQYSWHNYLSVNRMLLHIYPILLIIAAYLFRERAIDYISDTKTQ